MPYEKGEHNGHDKYRIPRKKRFAFFDAISDDK